MADFNMSTRFINPASGDVLVFNGTSFVAEAPSIPSAQQLKHVTVTLSSPQILVLHTTPVELIAAQGAGKSISVVRVTAAVTAGTPYAGGSNVLVYYTTSGSALGALGIALSSTFLTTAVDNHAVLVPGTTGTGGTGQDLRNQSISVSCVTPFTTGTGTLSYNFWYVVN